MLRKKFPKKKSPDCCLSPTILNSRRFFLIQMKTFAEFITEVHDKDVMDRSQIRKSGEGGRIGANRKKSTPERRRMKAVGGGKMEPVQYKDRKDIGSQKQRSTREQQPTQERGSAADAQKAAARAERKRAAQARIAARKSGGEVKKTATTNKSAEKKATELLKKKTTKVSNPNYKPQKASGLSAAERKAVTKKGERTLRDLRLKNLGKKSEKDLKHPITQKEITRRNKAK